MDVLVACEFSGRVRDAFKARGHHAISCDILPTDAPGNHYQGDVRDILYEGWDMLIAFPPCTYLTVAANRLWEQNAAKQKDAIDFFLELYNAPIPQVCIENPVGKMNTYFRKPDQIIHPWMFGHTEYKRTCLWLKNLPKLTPTKVMPALCREKKIESYGPSPDRWKLRSLTYTGIAQAMAEQWG